MPEAILQKEACENCGADVRPDTQFCYNCGKPVVLIGATESEFAEPAAAPPTDESRASLAELENALAAEFPPTAEAKSKIESAAAERRRARKTHRKTPEIVWEPATEGNRLYVLVVTLIFIIVAAIVFMTVFLK